MELKFTTNTANETAQLGEKLGKLISSPTIIAFRGGMGSGKTCFTAGLCKGLGYNSDVTSPTFAIINEYLGGRLPIFHFDVYRISDDDELYGIGFYDYLERGGVTVIEWSENIDYALFEDKLTITFSSPTDTVRELEFNGNEELLKELQKACEF